MILFNGRSDVYKHTTESVSCCRHDIIYPILSRRNRGISVLIIGFFTQFANGGYIGFDIDRYIGRSNENSYRSEPDL